MKRSTRRLLLGLPLALVLLFLGAYLLVDAWLESAGGRRAVEKTLAERMGLPVRLEGDFQVMLLPAIGVSGTRLAIGGTGPVDEILRSGKYALSLELRALLDGRVVIETIRLDDGSFQLQRWLELEGDAGGPDSPGISVPEVRLLELNGFRVTAEQDRDESYLLQELRIDRFAEESETPFRLVVEDLGAWAGSFSWSSRRAELELAAAGSGAWSGTIRLQARARLDTGMGTLGALWAADPVAPKPRPEVRFSVDYALHDAGVGLDDLQLDIDALSVRGDGCLLTADQPALHLELVAERVDLDALPELDAFTTSNAPASTGWEPPLEFNVRLSAAEILKNGAVARQAVLRVGGEPDCRELVAVPSN